MLYTFRSSDFFGPIQNSVLTFGFFSLHFAIFHPVTNTFSFVFPLFCFLFCSFYFLVFLFQNMLVFFVAEFSFYCVFHLWYNRKTTNKSGNIVGKYQIRNN